MAILEHKYYVIAKRTTSLTQSHVESKHDQGMLGLSVKTNVYQLCINLKVIKISVDNERMRNFIEMTSYKMQLN